MNVAIPTEVMMKQLTGFTATQFTPCDELSPIAVIIQLNILILVGTANIIVAAIKYARVSTSIPTVNI